MKITLNTEEFLETTRVLEFTMRKGSKIYQKIKKQKSKFY